MMRMRDSLSMRSNRITTDDGTGKGIDWVIPTAGGYCFAPSIGALSTKLAAKTPRAQSAGGLFARLRYLL